MHPIIVLEPADLAGRTGLAREGEAGLARTFVRGWVTDEGSLAHARVGAVTKRGVLFLVLWARRANRGAGIRPSDSRNGGRVRVEMSSTLSSS